jgi:hypothetical protein
MATTRSAPPAAARGKSVSADTGPVTTPAEPDGGAHRTGDVVRAGRVPGVEHGPAAARRDRVRHPLAAGPVLVEEDQGRPVRGEQVRARRPDPAGRAGDNPDPAAQPLVAGRGGFHDHGLGLPRALAQMMIIRSARVLIKKRRCRKEQISRRRPSGRAAPTIRPGCAGRR